MDDIVAAEVARQGAVSENLMRAAIARNNLEPWGHVCVWES
jgi:hypothetical protein